MTKKSADGTRRELIERIRTEGVEAAYGAALDVCRDKKAPAPARATAATTIFRVAGYMSAAAEEPDKPPHEMTAAELQAFIRAGEARIADLQAVTEEQVDEAGPQTGIYA
ncbi:hypothetical protein [Methylobacterium sp. WL9]|uniref:hypothetical protein n=1 Tax=Methylobacterium sp. WL9 TaxID=2603898 RepID=UPI00164F44A5|nr:hypothetical protein [Methylobacterium sp. WL9]